MGNLDCQSVCLINNKSNRGNSALVTKIKNYQKQNKKKTNSFLLKVTFV